MSGTHRERSIVYRHEKWVPAFAGMTVLLAGMTVLLAGMTVLLAGLAARCAEPGNT